MTTTHASSIEQFAREMAKAIRHHDAIRIIRLFTPVITTLVVLIIFALSLCAVGVTLISGGIYIGTYYFDPQSFYAERYGIPLSRVYYQSKPYDCDFDTPPFGSKHCHYKEILSVSGADDKPTSVYVTWKRVYD